MSYNRYELKRYGDCRIVLYTLLAGMVATDLSFKR